MSEWNYVVAAYVLTWVGILGYAVYVSRRLRRAADGLAAARVDRSELER